MRAISLWQPWASAIALGSKTIETRHWPTKYRGPLVIHAAKRRVASELRELASDYAFCAALNVRRGEQLEDGLPFGAIVAIVRLTECWPTRDFRSSEIDQERLRHELITPDAPYVWTEREMGDFAPGRFGWVLTNIRALQVPIPFRGAQGFFNVPDDLLVDAHLKPATGATYKETK